MSETLPRISAPRIPPELSEQDSAFAAAAVVGTGQLTVWAILGTVGMLFAGFASAYLVRHEGLDWVRVRLPDVLWLNTIVLLGSSATLEIARAARHRGDSSVMTRWIAVGTTLGVAFLAGQASAWHQLVAQGIYLPSNPYSSFFYMLTAVHGVHLLGGIVALGILLWRVSRVPGIGIHAEILNGCATYWHFLGGIWIFLYLLLLFY